VKKRLNTRALEREAYNAYAACMPVKRTKKVPSRVAGRRAMPSAMFAIPGERKFPLKDPYHAKLALTSLMRIAGRHGATGYKTEAKKVLSAVRRHYPQVFGCEKPLVSKIRRTFGIR
jgi:hypothetical protein